ncbi:MAG: phage portal protein [Bacteroidia bacterium]|nr:phage portal protein [Bacteroidia bacterium]
MGLFSKIFNLGEKKGVPYSFFYNSGIMSNIVTKNDALDFYKSWVYGCVARRSMGLAQIEFKAYKLKGDKVFEVLEHPVLELLNRVNSQMTKYNFIQLSVVYRDLLGASPWILEGGDKNGNNPTQMYIARPEYFKAEKDKEGNVVKYVYEIGTYKREYSPNQVIFLKNYNPKNPDKGIGIIEAVRMTAENDDYMLQSNNNLLKEGAISSGFLETEEILDNKEIKRLEKKSKAKMAGFENAHKIQILQGGMKFKPNVIPPRDLEFIEGRKLNRDEILGIFGVPKSLMTFDDVNRASAVAGEYQFNKWTLEPLATEICEQLNEFLVPKFDDDIWLGFEPLAKEDEEIELKKKTESVNRWRTVNEVREMDGLTPIKGGEYIYMPLTSLPMIGGEKKSAEILKIGDARKMDEGRVDLKTEKYVKKMILNRKLRNKKLSEKATKKAYEILEGKKKVVFKLVDKKAEPKKKLELSKDVVEAWYKARMAEEESLEKIWSDTFKKFFKAQEGRFIAKLEKVKKSVAEDIGIDVEDELSATIEIINPLMYETVMRGAKQASELINQPAISDFQFLREWLDKVGEEIGKNINDTTITAFDTTIREGIAQGENIGELTKRVRKVFSFAGDTRAEMIARTETARGITEAHLQTYMYYGFNEAEWLLSPGACEECVAKSQNQWTMKSIQGEIPVHPNCKCDIVPI